MMSGPGLIDRLAADELWTLLDHATLGVWKWDLATDEVFWSESIHRAIGTQPGETGGLEDIRRLVHPDDLEAWVQALESTRRCGGVFTNEVRLARADGRYLWVRSHGIWLPRTGEEPMWLVGFLLDVSEIRDAREALRRSEARFRAFFDHAPVAAYLKDAQHRHVYANPAAAEIAGTPVADLSGRTTAETFPAEVAERLMEVDRRVLSGHTVETWSGSVSATGGGERRVYDIKFPVQDIDSDALLVGGFSVDVTEQTIAQERLLASQRLESVGVLAGGVAHDFNNFMVAILGNAELARSDTGTGAEHHLDAIIETARRASELCEQLLAYAGRSVTRHSVVHVPTFVRETASLLSMSTRDLGVLEYDIDDECLNVEIDPGQLRQILMNLVMNAAQASTGPSVPVRIRCDTARRFDHDGATVSYSWLRGPGPFVRLSVIDRGAGLSPETASQIFDPFFTTKAEGHGLGLASVLGIVRANRGAIRVDSVPSEGTEMSVYFATTEAPVTPDAPLVESAETPLVGRAVVVDDEPAVAEVCRLLLERLGLSATVVHEGAEAAETIAETEPELVLLDLTMPNVSGVEVLRALREQNPRLPVILSSGYTEDDVAALLDEYTIFLHKPYSAQEFRRTIRAFFLTHHNGK